jgi:Family of unknown function (DUF5706)
MDTTPKNISAEVSQSKVDEDRAVVYGRKLFDNVIDWYRSADAKAQVLLALAGTFLSFLTSSMFMKRDELNSILNAFGPETWAFWTMMILCLVLTIGCALMCLRSRTADPPEFIAHLDAINRGTSDRQWAETLWFFGMIAQLKDRERFQTRLVEMTAGDEIQALSSQIFLLSKNVARKHRWVNRSVLCIVLTLIFFLASGISYVCHVHAHATLSAPQAGR